MRCVQNATMKERDLLMLARFPNAGVLACIRLRADIFRFAKELLPRRQGVGARDNSIAHLRAFCCCREVCANAEKASHSLILDDAILRGLGASV